MTAHTDGGTVHRGAGMAADDNTDSMVMAVLCEIMAEVYDQLDIDGGRANGRQDQMRIP